ncbi:MAG: hypothetical protein KBF88_01975 [Polyangiaceae bacterium]|nr:hypothetical protein [Polyangiaceae bacterium]
MTSDPIGMTVTELSALAAPERCDFGAITGGPIVDESTRSCFLCKTMLPTIQPN